MNLVNKEKINKSLSAKIVDARVAQIFNSFDDVLVTSSFGTTSVVLLHIISRIQPDCPIYFIDTGYHFEETKAYKERLTWLLDLNVIDVHPNKAEHEMTKTNRLWDKDPDHCCEVNKVKPLESVKEQYNVWMSGLIGFQNQHRSTLEIIDEQDEMIKFYPLIEWNSGLVAEYIESHSLPQHPLKEQGYYSVGCTHCTVAGMGREGRWQESAKTECGLHS
ncbi:phosphoadenylylsulfate reductase (thioredoxin) [Fodinibius salinus]|uniref:Adenosine 5'-phosphosulfate reductase n=1 Tax=Fodinibius salinus TaxID=860790 RepID=A0A5D3YLX7_9BACT|nr:phosphoadenylyl-sulfate reductase [Fodinibius salinus]TYP93926.1 phosphoadenylylsulfate reductase (thioredoxin) [Fodinibius salinus]